MTEVVSENDTPAQDIVAEFARWPAQDMSGEFARWLRDGGGDYAQEMLLHNRLSIVLATTGGRNRNLLTEITWLYDGAGLSMREVTKRGSLYKDGTAEEFFLALQNHHMMQFVGTTSANFFEALRSRLLREAEKILRSGNCSDDKSQCVTKSRSVIVARNFVQYEECGPPKLVDFAAITLQAARVFERGENFFSALRSKVFAEHHGFWKQLLCVGEKHDRKHWSTCSSCRAVFEPLVENRGKLALRILSTMPTDIRLTCVALAGETPTSEEEALLHIESCEYCRWTVERVADAVGRLLSGENI